MTGRLYGDGGLECLAEVPLWQRHLECALSVPLYALLAYKGHRMIKASVDESMAVKSQSKHPHYLSSDAWLAVLLAFVLGWEFVFAAPSIRWSFLLCLSVTLKPLPLLQVQASSWLLDILYQPLPPHHRCSNLSSLHPFLPP
jgi:hypothetical protein